MAKVELEGAFSEVALRQRDDVRLLTKASVHYAKIGEVWQHLPQAEVLRIERPTRYWKSHAGSSSYPLTCSPERDYGVLLFLERAGSSAALEGSAYRRLLNLRGCGSPPDLPRIALELLGDAAEFVS